MSFLYPYFLFASAAIIVPIIIHFFNFRSYKTVYFSNIQFLQNIKEETKSSSQIRHLLILLARILTILCLVFAFSKPFLPSNSAIKNIEKTSLVSIYIDNSFSMNAESESGNLLEVAKSKARNIADAFANNTRFLLITNDFEARHQHLLSKDKFSEMIGQVKLSARVRKTSEVLLRYKDYVSAAYRDANQLKSGKSEKQSMFFMISDFQKISTDFAAVKKELGLWVQLVPLSKQTSNNLFIDSCWFETKGRKFNQNEDLFVKIVNKSTENYLKIPLKLSLNDTLKSLNTFDIAPNESKIIKLSYSNVSKGIVRGKIEINDYPILFDNQFYFNYSINDSISILSISEKGQSPYLSALYAEDPYLKFKTVSASNLKTGELNTKNVVVLEEVNSISTGMTKDIASFVTNGGCLVVVPSVKIDKNSYNLLLKQLGANQINSVDTQKTVIDKVELKSDLFKDVFKKLEENMDFPVIFKHYIYSESTVSNSQTLLLDQNKHSILSFSRCEKGKIFLFSIPFSPIWSNFAQNPLFVPTLYNIPLFSQFDEALYYFIGENEIINLNQISNEENNVIHISDFDNKFDFIPSALPGINGGINLNMIENINSAGHYLIKKGTKIISGISYNYSRNESLVECNSVDEIKTQLRKFELTNFNILNAKTEYITSLLKQINQGRPLWKWFIIFALVFIVSEIMLIRFWKV